MSEVEPIKTQDALEIEYDSPEEKDEIEFDSVDLQLDNLASEIQYRRSAALSPMASPDAAGRALSLPEVIQTHSKRLGLTDKQFARAAANQGLDLGVLVTEIGQRGNDAKDVFKTLEDGGMVSFKPLNERKKGMRDIRKKRLTALRGDQINQYGQARVLSGEKEIELSAEELATARPKKEYDFTKIKDPSKRQLAVAEIVYEMGSDAGFSQDQMAAILANGFAESRLDPMAVNPVNEDSHGVWQFNRAGSGEGRNFTVEQLQDPRFQMEQIIKATKSRDELAGFRDPTADANQLTEQFMLKFEKPARKPGDIKARQAFLGQANRLLSEAAKTSPKGQSIENLKARKRSQILDRLQRNDGRSFRLVTDEESKGGRAENEVAQPGSPAFDRYEREVQGQINEKFAADPERARLISQTLAKYSEGGSDTLRETFADSAFNDLMNVGLTYDVDKAAEKLGISSEEFKLRAGVEGSKEHKIREYLRQVNTRHAALYVTTNKLGVPALVSYEFMDPKNVMGEERYGKGDNYFKRLFFEASRNRVQMLGLDDNNMPVFRAQGGFDSLASKLDVLLSLGSGALERALKGPEGESVMEALKEGSIQGLRDQKNFTKVLLSTDAARDSGVKALGLGAVGVATDILMPDPTLGLAGVVSKTAKGAKAIKPIIKRRYVPQTLDRMGTAANDMIEAQKLIKRASEKFAEGDMDGGRNLLEQAKKFARTAEAAEKSVRKEMKPVMELVDRTDSEVATEIARDVPLLMGRNTKPYEDSLGFSDFGLRRDYVHPSVERVAARGDSEGQIVEFPEFFDLSRKLHRLSDMSRQIDAGDVADTFVAEVQATAMDKLMKDFSDELASRGFSRVRSKTQKEETTNAIQDALAFMRSTKAAKILAESPSAFDEALKPFVDKITTKPSKTGRTIVEDLLVPITNAHKKAKRVEAASAKAVEAADLNQQLIDVTKSVAGMAESRGAAHAFARQALAKQEKVKIEPIIQTVMNRYEEIGTGKISGTALQFRNELEEAFPAMRGDAAMHVARNLDDRLKAIHRRTGEDISIIYETRDFKNIIPDMKRKASVSDEAAQAVGKVSKETVEDVPGIVTDPKFSKLDEGDELLTSDEVREFTRNISERLEREDMTDFTAQLATKTVKELKALAKAKGIRGVSRLRKSDLIDTLTRNEKVKTFLPDEYLRRNPEVAAQHETAKQKVIDAQKDFEKALDELDALEAANSPTARNMLNRPSAAIEAAMARSDDAIELTINDVQVRMFKRDLAEARVREAEAIRSQRLVELENLRRIAEGKAEETIGLAEDLDFIPGMVVKVEGNNLVVKSIELPDELKGRGIATTLYKVAMQRAKSQGLGFSSDVNPSPEAQRIYERLIEQGLPIKKIISREPNPETIEAQKTLDKLIDDFEGEFNEFRRAMREVLLESGDIEESSNLFKDLKSPFVGLDEERDRLTLFWDYRSFESEMAIADPAIPQIGRDGGELSINFDFAEQKFGVSSDRFLSETKRLRDEIFNLAANDEFLAKLDGKPVETTRYVVDASDLNRLTDDVLTADVATKKTKAAAKPEDITNFVEDAQKTVRAMEEAPTVEDLVLNITEVARRELSSDQMGSVTQWLATKGIKVAHKGASFVADDPATVAQAEEAFAKAFSEYAKGRPPPTTQSESAFERVKNSLLERFASAKNAAADGASFKPSSEIEQVFDDILIGANPTEQAAPNIFKAISRALVDDLPKTVGQDFLMSIARESDRLGHPISVKQLKALVEEAGKKYAKNPSDDVRIELPGPVQVGGLLAPKAKSSFTMLEFARGAAAYASRKRMTGTPATRKIALDSEVDAIREMDPTQMIDQYIKTSRPLVRYARNAYLGGDAIEDMRDLPPTVRKAIMAGVRITQQAIGDTVTLIHEGAASGDKLVRFITGDPQIKFKSGRNALSAGHDMMGSSVTHLQDYLETMSAAGGKKRQAFAVMQDLFNRGRPGTKLTFSKAITQPAVKDAFDEIVFSKNGSVLVSDMFKATGLKPDQNIEPKHLDMLETIFHITGQSERKGKRFVGESADQFKMLYKDIERRFPMNKPTDEPVANRVTCLIAGHGQAIAARLRWVDLGIATDAKTAAAFKRWIRGEAVDDPAQLQKVREVFQAQGYNPRFLEASDLDGLGFYVPKSARKKLSMALEQATDPDLREFSGDMLEALGKGLKSAESYNQLAAAWTMRTIKTRMVRGHFLLKSRYFWMNTMDHFNQMSQVVGFRPAFISTMRILPQTFASNPVFQGALFGIQKAGKDEAGEVMRQALTSAGDKGADWAARLMRSSKWRGDLNSVLEARDGFLVVDGVPYSYADLRRIGVEEGLSASFDTAELGVKIRRIGSQFLDDAKARELGRKGDLLGVNIPGSISYEEMTKIAEDMAEGWSERERYGAMMTLVEMGVAPRKAARLTIDALYDYAGSMSKGDRHWLVNIFLPFWAFQKNANRQLIDVVFSPRGAYRLGVLRRFYERGTDVTTQLLYEGMVDPLGVNTDSMTTEELDAYEGLKAALLEEYGVPVSQLPQRLKQQIRLAFSGRATILENGRMDEIDSLGMALRDNPKYKEYRNLLDGKVVARPNRVHLADYDSTRDAFFMPYALNEQNKVFFELMQKNSPQQAFTAFLLPEQSYVASAKFLVNNTMALFQIGNNLREIGPEYFTDAEDGSELFRFMTPATKNVDIERGLLVGDLMSAIDVKDGRPYRLAPMLAKLIDQLPNFDVLPADKKTDPIQRKLGYSEAVKQFKEGKIPTLTEDPFLLGETLEPVNNYYLPGGIGAAVLRNSAFHELNQLLLKYEKTPFEDVEGLRGEIQRFARLIGIVDVRDVIPERTMRSAKFAQKDEVQGEEFLDVKKRDAAQYLTQDKIESFEDDPGVDVPRASPASTQKPQKQKQSDIDRIERLKKRDSGEKVIDL